MEKRSAYRAQFGKELTTHLLTLGETDLAICLPPGVWTAELAQGLRHHLTEQRSALQAYLRADPTFAATHAPHVCAAAAPPLAREMARAAAGAGVGPMAAVAGAFARVAGVWLAKFSAEVIVENGGDLYLATTKERIVGVYAGADSPFTGHLGLRLTAEQQPVGVCASSGKFGPSFSYGRADVAVVIAPDPLLADAAATATANRVQTPADMQRAVDFAATVSGVTGALAICGDRLAAWGALELCEI